MGIEDMWKPLTGLVARVRYKNKPLRAAKWLRCLDIGALLGNFMTILLDFCPWHSKSYW